MSRLGKLPIELTTDVEAKLDQGILTVKGPKGQLRLKLHNSVKLKISDNEIIVTVKDPETKKDKAFWGLFRSLVNNMVIGVTKGFEKKLEINGVGYKATGGGKKITFNLGYSHPIEFDMPEGIESEIAGKIVTVRGIDKQLVGETAAQIRKLRKPEPYKGKGIKYIDEIIRRKAGKTAAGAGA
jgi:large subunit ribosomal protein L6